jgi:hypothetical protein
MTPQPGRSAKRRSRWLWIVPVLALAVGGLSLRALRRPDPLEQTKRRAATAGEAKSAFADLLARMRAEPDPAAWVQARAGKQDAATVAELAQAYAAWAPRGDTVAARREIIKQLLGNADPRVGMEALLRAVALDTTPRQQDPLWRELVAAVSGRWDGATIASGRDLLQTESNPRAKDLLIESLADVTPAKIGLEQQNLLVTDLIDLYPYAAADQKAALDRALAAMAGPDVVEILAHRGINEGSAPLASIQRINDEVEASRAKYKKVLEQIEHEEREAQETNAREAAKGSR